MIKAALLYRVSTERQKEKYSLSAQKRILSKYAIEKNWNITEYNEGAVSGTKLINRPVMMELLKNIEKGSIDIVCVIEIERITRDIEGFDRALILKTFRDHNIKIATPSQLYDPNEVEDDFMLDLFSILSKREIRKKSERCKRGIHEAKLKGRWLGGIPPVGYKYNFRKKKLEKDKYFAGIIKKIFNKSLTQSNNKILIWLYQNNIPTLRVGKWDNTRIRRILKNIFYAGYFRIDDQLIKGEHPPIVDLSVFNRVQRAIKSRVYHDFNTSPGSLLIGLIYCKSCLNRFNTCVCRKKRKAKMYVKRYYRCRGRILHICNRTLIQQEFLDNIIIKKIYDIVKKISIIKDVYKKIQHEDLNKIRLVDLNKEISSLKSKKNNLIKSVENGIFKIDEVKQRVNKLNSNLQTIKMEIEKIEKERTAKISLKNIEDIITRFNLNFNTLSFDMKRELLSLIIDKILVCQSNAFIYFKFPVTMKGNIVRVQFANFKSSENYRRSLAETT